CRPGSKLIFAPQSYRRRPCGPARCGAQGEPMNEIMAIWADWLKPSAGLPTVQWSILLAVAAAVGHLVQRHTGVPKVVGYSITGALAGLAGFSGGVWPLDGIALFLLALGVSVVL